VKADLQGCDFTGLNLTGANFSGSNLKAANFTGANLTRANFAHARLISAVLNDTVITSAVFSGAQLRKLQAENVQGDGVLLPHHWQLILGMLVGPGADLEDALLHSAVLPGLDLAGVNLSGAQIQDSDLVGDNLSGADLTGTQAAGADAEDANLTGATVTDATWTSAQMIGATLDRSDFGGTDLSGAQLTGAFVTRADLGTTTLQGVGSGGISGSPASLPSQWSLVNGYLVGPTAALGGAQLAGAGLQQSDLAGSTLSNADLSSSNLSNGSLAQADLSNTQFSGSNLTGQNLSGSTLSESQLGNSNLVGATGTNVVGAPQSLPTGFAIANSQLVTVPSSISAVDYFNTNNWIESSNGQFTVVMQSDGNLVEYQAGTAIWATGTGGAVQTVFQGDCNLVIYQASEVGQPSGALYTTGTGGGPNGCTFSVADDGSLAITTPSGTVLWERYANGTIYTHRIQMSKNAPFYNGTTPSSGQIGTIPIGDSPDYVCWTQSQSVGGVDVWFYVLWNGSAGYYPSYYDNSVYSYDARISIDYGIPRCGSVPTTFTPPSNGTVTPTGPPTIAASIATTADTEIYSAPSTSSGTPLELMPAGTNPGFICWTTGEPIGGVDVWFSIYWNGVSGYYASNYDNSHYAYDSQITSKYGIPNCSGGSGATPPPPTPSPSPSGPVIASPDPTAPYAQLLLCPYTACQDVTDVGGNGVWLPNGTPVTMLCWTSAGSATVAGQTSSKWFAVFWRMGTYHQIYAWVWSNLVANQVSVPSCSDPSMDGEQGYIE
jgi:uncharacterized protein YjbI with pentapeptide repeats